MWLYEAMSIFRPAKLLALTLLLSACGWHLQGGRDVAMRASPIYLELDDEHSEFARALQMRLRNAGVELAASAASARVTLQVTAEESGHHISAVSALNEPQQYEVYYGVSYRITGQVADQHDISLTPVQSSRLSRTMNYEKTAALAMQRQEQMLQQRLAEELAEQVLRKLSVVTVGSATG